MRAYNWELLMIAFTLVAWWTAVGYLVWRFT